MKRSEKILLTVFGIMFLAIVGGGALTYLYRSYSSITAETERLQTRLDTMVSDLAQGSDWQKRSDWLDENTVKFSSNEEASSKLFEAAQKEATATGLKITTREMIPQAIPVEGEPVGYFDKATIRLTFTEVQEEPFYQWIYNLTIAQPKAFIGLTRLTLSPSPAGKSINAQVELTQFYAQTTQPKLTRAD
jgi:hypothetical protein